MRKKAEGKPGRFQLAGSAAINEESGRVARIGIAKGSYIFVETTKEGRTTTNARRALQDCAINIVAEFGHRFCFVDGLTCEQGRGHVPKRILRRNENIPRIRSAAGNIQQGK